MTWEGGSIETGVEFSVSDGNQDFRRDPNGFDQNELTNLDQEHDQMFQT